MRIRETSRRRRYCSWPLTTQEHQSKDAISWAAPNRLLARFTFLLLAFNLIALTCGVTQQPLNQTTASKTTIKTIRTIKTPTGKNLVNLNDILIHQQALISECKRLERQKLDELKQVVKFERHYGNQLFMHDKLTLKLPAVCLYLLGPPAFLKAEPDTTSGEQDDARAASEQLANRIDMVNWIYDDDELDQIYREPAATSSSSSKPNRSKRAAIGLFENNDMLNEYLFDPTRLEEVADNATSGGGGGPDATEEAKFHEQVNEMLGDEQFQVAIKQERERISAYLSPVILVPGLAGSRLQARVQASKPKVNIICSKQTGWQDMWLTLRWFLPLAIDCWIDNVRLEFDPVSGFTRQPAGVEARVPDFGSVESVRYLDLKSPQLTQYYQTIIERYELLGYEANKNLFAAPYDFRLAPQQLQDTFFTQLRDLIEFAYSNTVASDTIGQVAAMAASSGSPPGMGGAGMRNKVTLVCHSMGCTHVLIFLRQQTAAWRQAKIRKLIALSSPWGGSVKALKALLVGEQFGLPIVSELKMRKLVRTFPGVPYLLPQAEVFERPNKNQLEFGAQVLVQTPNRSYTVNQMEALLKDAGIERQWDWFSATAPLIDPLNPLPDVDVDCLHSLNIPTTETIIFRNISDFPNGDYDLVRGDGDGTVNHQSLLVCGVWAAKLPNRVKHKIIMNTSHSGMLKNKEVLEHLTDDVVSIRH